MFRYELAPVLFVGLVASQAQHRHEMYSLVQRYWEYLSYYGGR